MLKEWLLRIVQFSTEDDGDPRKRVKVNVIGVALNEVHAAMSDRYYYYGYYGKYYSNYQQHAKA